MGDQVVDFAQVFEKTDLRISREMVGKFEKYADLLIDWNEKINLTAIVDPQEIAVKHFLDSVLALDAIAIPYGSAIIDVGTGAGFPGMPIKIVRPDVNLTLLDSLNKRIKFLNDLSDKLEIEVKLVHERAEDAAQKKDFRESFDVAISRAVAPLNVLLEYCLPFVKVDGVFIALKGSNVQSELDLAQNAIKNLNAEIFTQKSFSLVNDCDRSIIVFKKTAKNLEIYPRNSAKIKKKPL